MKKKNSRLQSSDPIQSNPQSFLKILTQSNPIHGWIQSMSNSVLFDVIFAVSQTVYVDWWNSTHSMLATFFLFSFPFLSLPFPSLIFLFPPLPCNPVPFQNPASRYVSSPPKRVMQDGVQVAKSFLPASLGSENHASVYTKINVLNCSNFILQPHKPSWSCTLWRTACT